MSQVKAVFLYQSRKVITLINNDSIDQKAKLDRRRNSVQKQRVLIKDLNQVAWIADLTTENSLIVGPASYELKAKGSFPFERGKV